MIDMRIKPILVKRQSEWSVSGLWRKVAINRHIATLVCRCSGTLAKTGCDTDAISIKGRKSYPTIYRAKLLCS